MAVSQNDTNLRRCSTLLREFADIVDDLVGGEFEPAGDTTRVWDRAGRDTLPIGVKTTHLDDDWLLSRWGGE